MKILFLTNLPSPYRVDFFNEIGRSVDLTVIFERNNAKDREQKWLENSFKNFKGIFLNGIEFGRDNSLYIGIGKYLNKSYDFIILGVYNTLTSILAVRYLKRHGISFLMSIDGIFERNQEMKIKKWIKQYMFKAASGFLTSGEYSKDAIYYYHGKEPIFIYPFTSIKEKDILTTPVTHFEKQKYRNELQMPSKKIFLYVGQIIHRKGIDILLEAVSFFQESIELFIIGGEPKKEYIEYQRKMGLWNVHFLPFLKKNELKKYYKASDFFVLPTREDQWGLVVNEAMSNALPVITTKNCLSGDELIKGKQTGYIIHDLNVLSLKECFSKVINLGVEEYQNLEENCLKQILPYTIENMAKRHLEIFNFLKEGVKHDSES